MYASRYENGVLLKLWIQPRASRTALVGLHGDNLKISVKSPPLEGRANDECIELLAKLLHISKRQLTIRSGHQSRQKTVYIEGKEVEDIVRTVESIIHAER